MSGEMMGLAGMVVLLLLLFARMWIGPAMAFIGFVGLLLCTDVNSACTALATIPYNSVAFYSLSAVPLFVLAGVIVFNAGLSGDLFEAANKWVGHRQGGLAIATILACGGFAAISGSSMAGAVTMGKVALPEMQRYRYDTSMATSCIAAGGTLGIMIPPSIGFILYGILTEQSIGKLFMAGMLPGALLVSVLIACVVIITTLRPLAGPPGPKTSLKEKVKSLRKTWSVLLLFALVLGGIYFGLFTPTEAGAVAVFGAVVIALINRRLSIGNFLSSVMDTAKTTAMLMVLVVGGFILMRFLTISGVAEAMAQTVSGLPLSKYAIFAVIGILYLILGMFLEIMTCMVVTIPIIYPVITALGFDPIWFGVQLVLLMEMGLITPPIGMNVFALSGATNIPVSVVFRGVWPFVGAMLLVLVSITIFPAIALWIPNMM
jgi:tripartite ATP-independent transporter DctM subunit